MTLIDSTIEGGVESTAKMVKLATADWRKMALFLIALSCAGALFAYRMVESVVSNEVTNLKASDAVAVKRLDSVEYRLQKLEEAQVDLAVMKNDISWIRRSMEISDKGANKPTTITKSN